MKTKPAGIIELFAFGLVEVGALLLLAAHVGEILSLMWAVMLPVFAWGYARRRARNRTFTIVGASCGLAAFPISHALFSLIIQPFPLQLLGLLGLVAETVHGFPGDLAATILHLERHADTSPDTILISYLLNGIVWAVVYGLIGTFLDAGRRESYPHGGNN